MEKRLVLIQRGKSDDTGPLREALSNFGWSLETIELSDGEPLPRSLENIDGLIITGSDINVYEQSSAPLTVY
ncbi:MAG TPA: hypothetical protein PLR60_14075 [Syntrophorhabdaceae bacterium]|nr:hypothetical protein [Syntrophorhabdaceae bacterium]